MSKRTLYFVCLLFTMTPFLMINAHTKNNLEQTYDIVIYGGTSAGVTAAVQAARMGKSVVLIATGNHIGGMTSNGLGWVDVTKPDTLGGLAREYFNKVWEYYQRDLSWIWEPKHPIKGQLIQFHPTVPLMWVLEPKVAEKIFIAMVAQAKIPLIRRERLDRRNGVKMYGSRILQITMESGLSFKGQMFIDATYEGDLMAASHVSYTVGREPNSQYQETLNGIQSYHMSAKKFLKIDPYLVKGNPKSGLLLRVYPHERGKCGSGDSGVQAYNYRMCLTDVPQNRIPIEKPAGYDERQYEIVFRAIEAGIGKETFFKLDLLPNRKTDSNNNGPISTDYVGMNWNYPEADYATRKKIALLHEQWQRGLVWTLQNHPRVPAAVQAYYAPWGLPKDEFVDNRHWPYDLYVREARRMVSAVVIDEQTALGKISVQDGIGLASYNMDSHSIKYIVDSNGFLGTEGGLYKKVAIPYPISYQAIVPKRQECENLAVPVCLSASHAAYGSIRMEPTFMVLGQSAATAACLAINLNVALQDLPYALLRQYLLNDGQILDWKK